MADITIPARDLKRGQVIILHSEANDHEFALSARQQGRLITVGNVEVDWGVVYVKDMRGKHLAVLNHGDRVAIRETP